MHTHAHKTQKNKGQSVANAIPQKQSGSTSALQFVDNRPEAVAQRKSLEIMNNKLGVGKLKDSKDMGNRSIVEPIQKKDIYSKENKHTKIGSGINGVIQLSSDEMSSEGSTDEESRYYKYSTRKKKFSTKKGKRPSNQSSKKVVAKTAAKIKKEVPKGQRRPITEKFLKEQAQGKKLSEMDAGVGDDMSHAVSAQRLGMGIAFAGSAKSAKKRKKSTKALIQQIERHLSSDASSEDVEKTKEFAKEAMDSGRPIKKRLKAMDKLLSRENRVSSNLAGAASSTNRGIGGKDDPASTKKGRTWRHFRRRFNNQAKFEKSIGMDGSRFAAKKDSTGKVISSSHGRTTASAAAKSDYMDPDEH